MQSKLEELNQDFKQAEQETRKTKFDLDQSKEANIEVNKKIEYFSKRAAEVQTTKKKAKEIKLHIKAVESEQQSKAIVVEAFQAQLIKVNNQIMNIGGQEFKIQKEKYEELS